MKTRDKLTKAVRAAAGERMVDFEESIHAVIANKLMTAIERRKPEVARKMFREDNALTEEYMCATCGSSDIHEAEEDGMLKCGACGSVDLEEIDDEEG